VSPLLQLEEEEEEEEEERRLEVPGWWVS